MKTASWVAQAHLNLCMDDIARRGLSQGWQLCRHGCLVSREHPDKAVLLAAGQAVHSHAGAGCSAGHGHTVARACVLPPMVGALQQNQSREAIQGPSSSKDRLQARTCITAAGTQLAESYWKVLLGLAET